MFDLNTLNKYLIIWMNSLLFMIQKLMKKIWNEWKDGVTWNLCIVVKK